MRVLLVEPDYRKTKPKHLFTNSAGSRDTVKDETLWYPQLGLMKLSQFHKDRGDKVKFVSGCDPNVFSVGDLFSPADLWDRVYITTLFTHNFKKISDTIHFYIDAVGGTTRKIFVGGIMASLMADDIFEETGVYPITGILNSPSKIRLSGDQDIDLIPPDYEILNPNLYAINDTYYAYTTRGCSNCCAWCGVPRLEPQYIPYIDIKPTISFLRQKYGDKSRLCLMDNNVLASKELEKIVHDLVCLGYGNDSYTNNQPSKQRVVDFNQGLDASYMNEEKMKLLANLNIKPFRVAFDRVQEKRQRSEEHTSELQSH